MGSALETLTDSLRTERDSLVRMAPRVILALVLFVVLIAAGRIVGRVVARLLERGKLTRTHRNFFRHLVTWLFGLLGLVIALNVLGLQTAAAGLVAGGGITAVVLGFAFRGIGENPLAGFFLAFSRPFEVGDLIQSGEFQGIVRSLELRCTHIRAADGRDVYIPSPQIFNEPVVNFTRDGLRRLSFRVGIDYADDTQRARRHLVEALAGMEHLGEEPKPAADVSALLPPYQELEVSFWIDVFQPGTNIASVRSEAIERCRRALKTGGFTISADVTTSILLDARSDATVRVDDRRIEKPAQGSP